jgi:hypothetical protein
MNVRDDSPDEYQGIVRCTTCVPHEVFGLAEQPAISAAIMYVPELFSRLEWFKVDVLDKLAVRTMDRDRCRLNHVRFAIL